MKLVMSKKPIELLSPVGSFESLQAAGGVAHVKKMAERFYFILLKKTNSST
jgi:hypothetical protein